MKTYTQEELACKKHLKSRCMRCGSGIKKSLASFLVRGNFCRSCNTDFDDKILGRKRRRK